MTVTLLLQGQLVVITAPHGASRRARHAVEARRRTRERMVHVDHNRLTTRDKLWLFSTRCLLTPGCEVETVPSAP